MVVLHQNILLIVYKDGIIITSDDKKGAVKLKAFLQTLFQTKDLIKLSNFLGIDVAPQWKELVCQKIACVCVYNSLKKRKGGKPQNTEYTKESSLRIQSYSLILSGIAVWLVR